MNRIMNLGYEDAQVAINTISAELQHRGKTAVIAVADAQGEPIALARLDGAPLPSILIASNKAWTAARERKPSWDIGQAARHPQNGFDLAYFGDRRYIGFGGGVPVIVDGVVVGAVAVSGLTEAEDMEMAELGIAAMMDNDN